MGMIKNIEIDGKQVAFRASAAIPRIYRMKFQRDLLTIGMVNEMFIENQNDDVADKAYHRVASQQDFDVF